MNDPLLITLFDAVEFCSVHGLEYALIGGLATTVRGQPRATADVDFVILADVGRALAIVPGLEASKFRPLFDRVEEVVQRSFLLPLRHRTTGIKVDIALALSGFEQQLVARAQNVRFGEWMAAVATAEDLIVMKTLAGRPQDEQDVRNIIGVQGVALDWNYCLDVAAQLGVAVEQDLVQRLRELKNEALD